MAKRFAHELLIFSSLALFAQTKTSVFGKGARSTWCAERCAFFVLKLALFTCFTLSGFFICIGSWPTSDAGILSCSAVPSLSAIIALGSCLNVLEFAYVTFFAVLCVLISAVFAF